MSEFADQVVLVTGAARGIGRGIAEVLAERGASVIVNDRQVCEAASDLIDQIRSAGGTAGFIAADVSVEAEVEAMFADIDRMYGRLDVLVNNAGTNTSQDILDITAEQWDHIINVNLRSCFLCSKLAIPRMGDRKYGRIINISSVVARRGHLLGAVHYASSKSGQIGLTRTLARSAAPLGITVNAIAAGLIETDLLFETVPPATMDDICQQVLLGLGKPRDIGLAVAFLCGEGGRYITGATLDVNGGAFIG